MRTVVCHAHRATFFNNQYGNIAYISKSSIALIEGNSNLGIVVTLKEKRPDGSQITLNCKEHYTTVKTNLNQFEKMKP